jgi:hypothetical protein
MPNEIVDRMAEVVVQASKSLSAKMDAVLEARLRAEFRKELADLERRLTAQPVALRTVR